MCNNGIKCFALKHEVKMSGLTDGTLYYADAMAKSSWPKESQVIQTRIRMVLNQTLNYCSNRSNRATVLRGNGIEPFQ